MPAPADPGRSSTPLVRPSREVSLSSALPVLDLVETMIVVTDVDGCILYVNPWFTTVTGFPAVQAIGGNPRLLSSGVQPPSFYRDLWATVRSGHRWHGEVVNKRADGTLYLDEMTITPVVDIDSDEIRFVAAKKDVSRWMSLMSTGSPIGLLHVDADGRALWANELAANLLGVRQQVLGDEWQQAFSPATAGALLAACAASLDGGPQQRIGPTRDGRWLDCRFSRLPVPEGTRGALGVAVSLSDVTETVQATEALAERERLVSAVLDSLPDPTAVLDAHGRIVSVNVSWRTYGLSERIGDAGLGQSYLDACDRAAASSDARVSQDGAAVGALLREVLAGDRELGEYQYHAPPPAPGRWFLVRMSPLGRQDGGAVVAHVDVTWRRAAELELAHRASHDPLTGLVNRAALGDVMALTPTDDRTGVLFVDLDRFKPVNDVHGHRVGDAVLVEAAQRLGRLSRPGDTVARVGGDEFVVVCRVPDAEALHVVARRFEAALSQPYQVNGLTLMLTASVGESLYLPGTTAENALALADESMYARKRAAR